MTTQAERIKAFKLAQHTRFNKKEEEESWISGEELCTEGSSDEETHNPCKANHRRPKRQTHFEKRGISPLAQPAKGLEMSSYSAESNFLLADPRGSIEGFEVRWPDSWGTHERNVSKKLEKPSFDLDSPSGEDRKSSSDISPEEEKLIQWRPKRGSIKLPECPLIGTGFKHAEFEIESFHAEMRIGLVALKTSLKTGKKHKECGDDSKNLPPIVVKQAKNYVKSIAKLDQDLIRNNVTLKNLKDERIQLREETCQVSSEKKSTRKNEYFLKLGKINQNEHKPESVQEKLKKETCAKNHVKVDKLISGGKNFVARNIELAKECTMALTDEEKARLVKLLEDLDSKEYCVDFDKNIESGEEVEGNKPNVFRIIDEDSIKIKDIDVRLADFNILQEDSKDAPVSLNDTEEDQLEIANKKGKYWKQHQLQQRLHSIDKKLQELAVKQVEDDKKYVEHRRENCDQN